MRFLQNGESSDDSDVDDQDKTAPEKSDFSNGITSPLDGESLEVTNETSDTSFESDEQYAPRSFVNGFMRIFSFRSGFPVTSPSWMWFRK